MNCFLDLAFVGVGEGKAVGGDVDVEAGEEVVNFGIVDVVTDKELMHRFFVVRKRAGAEEAVVNVLTVEGLAETH